MASLVSQDEINVFTGDFQNLFDTFKRSITVFKRPKKVVTASNVNDQIFILDTTLKMSLQT